MMVSAVIWKMGVTTMFFMYLGMNGINYYRDVLLSQQMLPAIKSVAGEQVYLPAG